MRQLKAVGPMVEGSIAMPSRKCGSPTCECARGARKHKAMILCKKVDGRSVATYVPRDLWDKVRRWNTEHKRIKRLIRQICNIDEAIIRNYVADKRREKDLRKSLKVLK